MMGNKTEINTRSKIEWTPYLSTAYCEGFCEGEDATKEEQVEAWAYMIKHNLWKGLQGWFGRTAANLIETEVISKDGVINWEFVETL